MRDPDPTGAAGALATAVQAVARGEGLDAALDAILAGVTDDRGAALAMIVSFDADGALPRVVRSHGLSGGEVALVESSQAEATDLLRTAAAAQRLVEATADLPAGSASATAVAPLVARLGLARLAAMPLVVASGGIDHVVGVLAVGWRATTAGVAATSPLVESLADLAAIAIDRSRLSAGMAERAEWAERLAHLDPLTGLANRRTFDRVLELELARAARQQSEVAVAIFDIDSFRATNEAVGHAAGDDVLRAVAAVIAEQVRLVDTVARIGGDEFVVVAPGNGGPAVAERVINAIRSLPALDGRPVSVSAGIARFPLDGVSPEELVAGALDALELARRGGRGAMATVPGAG